MSRTNNSNLSLFKDDLIVQNSPRANACTSISKQKVKKVIKCIFNITNTQMHLNYPETVVKDNNELNVF